MLMGWALDLLSFVVCSVLGFSCYSEAEVAWLTMLRCIIFSPNILWCLGDQDADGGGGAVHAGLAAAAAVRCPQPNIPRN